MTVSIVRRVRFAILTTTQVLALFALPFSVGRAEVAPLTPSGFTVTHEVVLPGTPEVIYDAFTGDVKPWWDHSWTENPKALYIESKPGGGFYEIFDDSGNGALHATVITAWRGQTSCEWKAHWGLRARPSRWYTISSSRRAAPTAHRSS